MPENENNILESTESAPSTPLTIDRRDLLKGFVATLIASQITFDASEALANDPEQKAEEAAEKLAHDPVMLQVLDLIGTVAFIDAVAGIARNQDSFTNLVIQKLKTKIGFNGEDHRHSKFPTGNIGLGLVLNAIRATAFGEEVSHHTLEEFNTTLKGVGLLLFLTSAAKGIVAAEKETMEMAEADSETLKKSPQSVINDSIFQLTFLATCTQLPLTAFGNASIGNEEFGEVREAFKNIYLNLPKDKESLKKSLDSIDNPKVRENVRKIADDSAINTEEEITEALTKASIDHSNDIMIVLMSTACDDAQAAAGDAGPLVGLFQSFGNDFIYAPVSILPYTIAIAIERGLLAAERAGVSSKDYMAHFAKKLPYAAHFIANTWKNLAIHFATIGHGKLDVGNGAGRDFDMFPQIIDDIKKIMSSLFSAVAGGVSGKSDTLDKNKIFEAIKQWNKENEGVIRNLVKERKATKQPLDFEARERKEMGVISEDNKLGELQELFESTAEDPNTANIRELQNQLDSLKANFETEIKAAVKEYTTKNGKTPSIKAIATLLKDNPKLSSLIDFDYWHDRIGPEMTDTMFVVFLQGLHLPFLINTFDRFLYNTEVFKSMPLPAQEVVSVLFNDVVSMFADNWADAVAHSKWLTNMYFNALDKEFTVDLSEKYPEIAETVKAGFFEDNSVLIVPERFEARERQFAALITHLKSQHPEDSEALDQTLLNFLERSELFYWKAMNMAMLTAVTGGGKALTGNSPHFTFAAEISNYDLATTLEDFKKHPLYHVWELIFSSSYSIFVGPEIAKGLFGDDTLKKMQSMMQESFRKQFPDFEKKLQQLEQQEAAKTKTPDSERTITRRGLFKFMRGAA